MSRRAASFTQADVHRALKAAQQAGVGWRVKIEGGVIRFERGDTKPAASASVDDQAPREDRPEDKWSP